MKKHSLVCAICSNNFDAYGDYTAKELFKLLCSQCAPDDDEENEVDDDEESEDE